MPQKKDYKEYLLYQNYIRKNPKLRKVLEGLSNFDEADAELKELITPLIETKLAEAKMAGIMIGWNSFALRAIHNIKGMTTVDEIQKYLQQEADEAKAKLGITNGTIEDYEKLFIAEDDSSV